MSPSDSPVTENSAEYFRLPVVEALGFREYDARWVIEPGAGAGSKLELNYVGVREIGRALGDFYQERIGAGCPVVVGHDFRRYAEHVKNALVVGLLASGTAVHDIGLATTPMSYFAQYYLDVPAVAMVTASHNPNGWTGIKMGLGPSRTFTPSEMADFKKFVNEPRGQGAGGGSYRFIDDLQERYLDDLVQAWGPRFAGLERLRVVVETGNGTAGIVGPELFKRLGFEVFEGCTDLDWNFPNFNPNPESIAYMQAVEALVAKHQVDVGLCFDGDGDRLGVVDDQAAMVFADRIGLLIAMRMLKEIDHPKFVVDVKSTSLFNSALDAEVVWAPTGHSYVKEALRVEGANAGFERSGHYFFAAPWGRGYDDGCVAALAMALLVAEAKTDGKKLSDLLATLPPSHQSPNRQPLVGDDVKYDVVARLQRMIEEQVESTGKFAGVAVTEVVRVNGVRLEFADGSWLLIRASSNTPNLVIVAETFDKDDELMKRLDAEVRTLLSQCAEVGDFESLYAAEHG